MNVYTGKMNNYSNVRPGRARFSPGSRPEFRVVQPAQKKSFHKADFCALCTNSQNRTPVRLASANRTNACSIEHLFDDPYTPVEHTFEECSLCILHKNIHKFFYFF